MDAPEGEVPEELDIEWDADEPGEGESVTVAEATLALVGLGVPPADLDELHEQGFSPDTPAEQAPIDLWRAVVERLDPKGAAVVAQLNQFFYQLVHEGPVPLADARKPHVMHAFNAAQLADAVGRGGATMVAVHVGIDGAAIIAAAVTTEKTLCLGPGVTAVGVTGGKIGVYLGSTVTDVTDGYVNVFLGGTVTDVTGGDVYVGRGGTVTGVTGGNVFINAGGSASVPDDIELHPNPRMPVMLINGADEASSTLTIYLGGGTLQRY